MENGVIPEITNVFGLVAFVISSVVALILKKQDSQHKDLVSAQAKLNEEKTHIELHKETQRYWNYADKSME
jgi:mannitol-specific phosphotransferase system IIBC component